MQCHVLGVDAAAGRRRAPRRRRPAARARRRAPARSCWPGSAGSRSSRSSYVPLVVHELTTDFAEVRAALGYLPAAASPRTRPARPPRRRGAPGRGLAADRPDHRRVRRGGRGGPSPSSSGSSPGGGGRRTPPSGRPSAGSGSGCSGAPAFLTVAAASLAVVIPGLPNDHYHAFADPMVFVLVGLGVAAAWRIRRGRAGPTAPPPVPAVAAVVRRRPRRLERDPPAAGRGTRTAASRRPTRPPSAARGAPATGERTRRRSSPCPTFKSADAMATRCPARRAWRDADRRAPGSATAGRPCALVVLCDAALRDRDRRAVRRSGRGRRAGCRAPRDRRRRRRRPDARVRSTIRGCARPRR